MTEYGNSLCPECGAGNGPGAPWCAKCGKTLLRPGFAARPIDDDDDDDRPAKKPVRGDGIQKGAPPAKKKPQPADDEEDERKPAKKATARPVDDEDDDEPRKPLKKKVRRDDDEEEEVRKPVKKKARRDDDEDEEPTSIREHTALNMLAPVGGSVWGLASLTFGILGCLVPVVMLILTFLWNVRLGGLGYAVPALSALISILAIPLAVMSFIMRPKKKNYGGITSYMRAIIGALCGLAGLVLAGILTYYLTTVR